MDQAGHCGDVVRLLGDNRGWKEGGILMSVAFLTKAILPKWELSEPIRSRHLTSPKWTSEHERQNTIVQTSSITVQGNLIQYNHFFQSL